MSDLIRSTSGAAGATPPAKGPAAPAAPRPAEPQLASDSFLRSPPTVAQLAGFRQAIAALDDLPKEPGGIAAKKAWVAQVRPTYEAAEKALDGMRSASFFHKSPPEAEADAAGDKVHAFGENLRDAEEATGLREPAKPANPFRPLFGYSKAVQGWMGNNAFTAIVGLIALPVAAVVDTADAVTRPLQALAFPVLWGQHKIREARFEKAQGE